MIEATIEKLLLMKLSGMAEGLRDQMNSHEYRDLGFDERFVLKWNYYLAYCEAAFALRNISVVQTVHTRPNNLSL